MSADELTITIVVGFGMFFTIVGIVAFFLIFSVGDAIGITSVVLLAFLSGLFLGGRK